MEKITIAARQLTKNYNTTQALRGVNIDIYAGETLAIMGASGSGKTTLLHCLAGIETPTSGQVVLAGKDLSTLNDEAKSALRRTSCGFVFQSGQLIPELPAEENVALPLMLGGMSKGKAIAKAQGMLQALGLAGMEKRRPGELSGGQAQRVAIARALVIEPTVIFADEPTGALDSKTSEEVMQLLVSACQQFGASLVLVTHDEKVASWCSQLIRMQDGMMVGA